MNKKTGCGAGEAAEQNIPITGMRDHENLKTVLKIQRQRAAAGLCVVENTPGEWYYPAITGG